MKPYYEIAFDKLYDCLRQQGFNVVQKDKFVNDVEDKGERVYSLTKWYDGAFFIEVIASDRVAVLIPHLDGWEIFPYIRLDENIKSRFPKNKINTEDLSRFLKNLYFEN